MLQVNELRRDSLDRSFGADAEDVKRVGKFVGHFDSPISTRLKLAIEAFSSRPAVTVASAHAACLSDNVSPTASRSTRSWKTGKKYLGIK